MKTNNYCPSCGETITPDMKSCPNCGENLIDESALRSIANDTLKKAQAVLEEKEAPADGIQIGSRSNVVGGITGRKIETQVMTENKNTHVEANTTNSVNTSHVDNSQKVVNSNTNNVTYNIIYQNAGPGNTQQPNQTPNIADLNPDTVFQPNPASHSVQEQNNQKGLGAIAGGQGHIPKNSKEKSSSIKTLIFGGIGLLIVIGLFLFVKKPVGETLPENENTIEEQIEERPEYHETSQPAEYTKSSIEQPEYTTKTSSEKKPDPTNTKETKTTTATNKVVDSNYDKGMEAYKSGEGLEAIKCFKSSGSAESNYMLGIIYEQGCGNVSANAMMARKYFKAAANLGHEAAKSKL